MAKYLGEQDADNSARPVYSDASTEGGNRDGRENRLIRRDNIDSDNGRNDGDGLGNDPVDKNVQEEELSRAEAMLSLAGQTLRVMLRGVIILIISLFLMAFSSCYWYNVDVEIRSKVERQKKIVEVHPDMQARWNAFQQILLLKERHDYLRSAFPSQIIFGGEIDTGPVPKEKNSD